MSKAPLIRVLSQARWPRLTAVTAEKIAPQLADAIRADYPLSDTQQEMKVTITSTGLTQQPGDTIYRFHSQDRTWTVTLSDLFLALDTSSYTDHSDFIDRFTTVFDALLAIEAIPYLTRLGYRYTNRLDQPKDILRLQDYFAPGILGGLAQDSPSGVTQTVSETLFKDGDEFLAVRSALLGPNESIDATLPPVATQSWILDLDAYRQSDTGLPVDDLRRQAEALSNRAGEHFTTLITDDFIERFS